MKILVTGGAGFIGSHVVDRLVERGDKVTVIDDLSNGLMANLHPDVELIQADLADPATISRLRIAQPEVVVHCAAQTSVAVSMHDPSFDARTNIVGGVNTIIGAVESGARKFVYVTTGGALYGNTSHPAAEEHPIRPASPYGLSKWIVKSYLTMLLPAARSRAVLRLANVYGPRQGPTGEAGVVSVFCDRMLRARAVTIHGDGLQSRDFVFVADVTDAIVAAVDDDSSIVANIGSGEAVTIRALREIIAVLVGREEPPLHVAPRPGDIRHSVLDVSLARRALGWTARTTLRDGLAATIEWHREAQTSTFADF